MKGKKIAITFLVLTTLLVSVNFGFAQGQSQTPITQFGNISYDDCLNLEGGVIIASQFSIQQSLTVTWMAVLTEDSAPYSFIRLGIFSDNNNQPATCLASTTIFPSQPSFGWYQLPLSNPVTLQSGTYWLAEVDSGAQIIKYKDSQGNNPTISKEIENSDPSVFFSPLDVGNTLTEPFNTLSGTLTIVASAGTPTIQDVPTPPVYAESAQCWTSNSNSNPYSTQTTYAAGTPVYIYWSPSNPDTGVVDISVNYPTGTAIGHATFMSFLDLTPQAAPISFVPTYGGTWTVTCNGYSTSIAVAQVDVSGPLQPTPEFPLGAIIPMAICFCALAIFIRKKKT